MDTQQLARAIKELPDEAYRPIDAGRIIRSVHRRKAGQAVVGIAVVGLAGAVALVYRPSGATVLPAKPTPSHSASVAGVFTFPATAAVDAPAAAYPRAVLTPCSAGMSHLRGVALFDFAATAKGSVSPEQAVRDAGYFGDLTVGNGQVVERRSGEIVGTFKLLQLPNHSWVIERVDVPGPCA